MVAMCTARAPISNDFGCGLKLNLSAGIRTRHLRVVAISRSNSGSSASLIFIMSSKGDSLFIRLSIVARDLSEVKRILGLRAKAGTPSDDWAGHRVSTLNRWLWYP